MNARGPLLWLLWALLPSCAWARRENRPVWNAFEEHLVPQSQGAFLATLPLTVPVGLVSILADTLVAHPLQVVDDAASDAGDLWQKVDFEGAYYTEAGFAPLRAVATPCWFLLSFVGRSVFDVPSVEQQRADAERTAVARHKSALEWFAALAAGRSSRPRRQLPETFDTELLTAMDAALSRAQALGRLEIYRRGFANRSMREHIDWDQALADPSAVVRFQLLQSMPETIHVSDERLAKLAADPEEAVRILAKQPRKR
jgi:hypothetical protein